MTSSCSRKTRAWWSYILNIWLNDSLDNIVRGQWVKYMLMNKPLALDMNLCRTFLSWWRHQMGTFSALLALCVGNSPVIGDFPSQRPVTRSFDVFFNLRLNKQLSKQSWGRWFETPSRPLWRHCNEWLLWGENYLDRQTLYNKSNLLSIHLYMHM